MKRSLLVAPGLFLLPTVQAQQWCAPGAEWLFQFESQQATGVRHAWYAGDTVVGGLPAKRIDQDIHAFQPVFPFTSGFYTTGPSLFTAEVGDRVMLWDNSSSSYDTLMWVGAEPGQHWDPPHFPGPARFDVLDTGTTVVDGISLHFLVVEQASMFITDTLLERIGFDYFYINPNETFLLDFTTTWLQCYSDDDIVEYAGSMQQYPCDFTLSLAEQERTTTVLSPNPGTDQFTLSLPADARTVTILNALGAPVHRRQVTGTQVIVDTSQLPAGVYLVRIDDAGPALRWVKH